MNCPLSFGEVFGFNALHSHREGTLASCIVISIAWTKVGGNVALDYMLVEHRVWPFKKQGGQHLHLESLIRVLTHLITNVGDAHFGLLVSCAHQVWHKFDLCSKWMFGHFVELKL